MDPSNSPKTDGESAATSKEPAQHQSVPQPRGAARIMMLIFGLAILAGTCAWIVGEFALDHYKPSEKAASQAYAFAALNSEIAQANALNGAIAFGVLGAVLGIAMGVGGGLTARSARGAVLGAVIGLVLGAAAGALPSFWIMPWQWKHRHDDPATTDILMPLLVHLGLWSTVGLAAGLAFALGAGGFRPLRLLEAGLAGLAGAMLGTFVFEMLGATLFPLSWTLEPFSITPETRLLARLCVAGFVALGAIVVVPSVLGRKSAPNKANPVLD
jgi:hypothetical protein